MRLRSYKLGNGMRQRRQRVDVEDGERVLALVHAPGGKNNGDEVDAGASKKRKRRRLCQKLLARLAQYPGETADKPHLYIHRRDVAHNVILPVHDRQRGDAFIVHQLQSTEQR